MPRPLASLAISALAAALLLALPAAAQPLGSSSIGVRAGTAFSTIRADVNAFSSKTDFALGLYGQIATSTEYLAIQAEVLYVRKGATLRVPDRPGDPDIETVELSLDYIEFPIMLRASLPVSERFFPSIYAGPYAAVNVGRNTEDDRRPFYASQPTKAYYNPGDIGMTLGAGVDIVLSGIALNVSGRYDWGLYDASTQLDRRPGNDPTFYNSTFLLTLGVAF